MWEMLIPTALSAGAGFMNAKRQQEQANIQNRINAEATRMSPWTGMKPNIQQQTAQDPIAAALAAGLQGADFGMKNFGGQAKDSPDLISKDKKAFALDASSYSGMPVA